MKILVIGGAGHVGSFLATQLLELGHEVVITTRTPKKLSEDSPLLGARFVIGDAYDPKNLQSLVKENFEVVIDFPGGGYNTYMAFRENCDHVIACGSTWMYGYPHVVPTPEIRQGKCPFEGYEKRYNEIQEMIGDSGKHRAVFTAIMPTNICGPGKIPLDTLGGRDINVHRALMEGQIVYLPDGPEALIGPCDAWDIANLFSLAVNNRTAAAGQIFNAGSDSSVTATQLVKIFSKIYGKEIPIKRVPWEHYKEVISPGIGYWWHFYAHMQPDISKARKLLGYSPRYTSAQSLARSVDWMFSQGLL